MDIPLIFVCVRRGVKQGDPFRQNDNIHSVMVETRKLNTIYRCHDLFFFFNCFDFVLTTMCVVRGHILVSESTRTKTEIFEIGSFQLV